MSFNNHPESSGNGVGSTGEGGKVWAVFSTIPQSSRRYNLA